MSNCERKSFMCSICCGGIIGGSLYLDRQGLVYKTNKLTSPNRLKNLHLNHKDVKSLTWKTFIFPIATFTLNNGEEFKFIIFNKRRFEKHYSEYINK